MLVYPCFQFPRFCFSLAFESGRSWEKGIENLCKIHKKSGPENWENVLSASPSAKAYQDRIKNISVTQPELLIGHHYTRYIGDLSGGQILRRIAKKAMNITGDQGLKFYDFDQIKDQKEFKLKYSSILNLYALLALQRTILEILNLNNYEVST